MHHKYWSEFIGYLCILDFTDKTFLSSYSWSEGLKMIRAIEMKTVREICVFCDRFNSLFQFTKFKELYDGKYTHKRVQEHVRLY
jgi:hypothetical protein